MKTFVAVSTVIVLAAVVVVGALGADAPSRPPGVSAADWTPISDTLGVVVDGTLPPAGDAFNPQPQSSTAEPPKQAIPGAGGLGAALIPPVSGYLMVKRGNLWQRLILVEPVKGPGTAG